MKTCSYNFIHIHVYYYIQKKPKYIVYGSFGKTLFIIIFFRQGAKLDLRVKRYHDNNRPRTHNIYIIGTYVPPLESRQSVCIAGFSHKRVQQYCIQSSKRIIPYTLSDGKEPNLSRIYTLPQGIHCNLEHRLYTYPCTNYTSNKTQPTLDRVQIIYYTEQYS